MMPETAAWVDALRLAFGADEINRVIRAGMKGEPVFHAVENGHELGTTMETADPSRVVSGHRLLPWGEG